MNTYTIEDQVRAMNAAQREWLIKMELANQRRLTGNQKRRTYQAEQFRKRAIKHILAGGGMRIR